MFKQFSKLILLVVSVLMVFSACTEEDAGEEGSGEKSTLELYLIQVGGKELQLPSVATGTKNLVSGTTGDIMKADKTTVLYKLESAKSPITATYSNGTGKYFGVRYDEDTDTDLDFYFDNSTVPTGDYWATVKEVDDILFESGDGVLLATTGEFTNFLPSSTMLDENVKTTGALSVVIGGTSPSPTDMKVYVLADNKTVGEAGTLFTGSMSNGAIAMVSSQVKKDAVNGMWRTDTLQTIGGAPYIVNTKAKDILVYDANGDKITGTSTITDMDYYATGSTLNGSGFYIAAGKEPAGDTKLYKVTATGIEATAVTLATTDMNPQSIISLSTDVYVAGTTNNTPIVINKVSGSTVKDITSDIGSLEATRIQLLTIGSDLYAVVAFANRSELNKYDAVNNKWTPVNGSITGFIIPVASDGNMIYFMAGTGATVVYIVDTTKNRIDLAANPAPAPTGLITRVSPDVVALTGMGILVVDVEKISNVDTIRYNSLKFTDTPFEMPTK